LQRLMAGRGAEAALYIELKIGFLVRTSHL
jgi:hypothetical protein